MTGSLLHLHNPETCACSSERYARTDRIAGTGTEEPRRMVAHLPVDRDGVPHPQ